MSARLLRPALAHPVAMFLTVAVITVATALGIARLQVDMSFGNLIPEDDPARIVYQQVMGEFGSDNRTIVYVRDPDLWSPSKLRALEDLHRRLAALPGVERVDGLFTLRTIRGEPSPEGGRAPAARIEAVPVLEAVPETLEEARAARERALENPLYVGNLLAEDGAATALVVAASDPEDGAGEDFSREIHLAMEAVLASRRADFAALFQVGPPRIKAELTRSLFEDFRLLAPLSASVLVVAIVLLLRSGLAALVPLLTSVLSIVWTFGLLGWLGVPLNVLSAMIPSLIIAIGSTEDTHLLAGYFRGLVKAGPGPGEREAGVRYLLQHALLPLVLTVFTTALGFAANLFSTIGLIQQFATAATLAMVANGLVTVLVVPPLLAHFGPRKAPAPFLREVRAQEAGGRARSLPALVVRTFRFAQERFPGGVLTLTAVLCLFFVYQASKLYVTNDPLSYFPDDRPLIRETEQINRDLAGVRVFFVTLEAETEQAFLAPENLRKLRAIQGFIASQGVFDTSISLADHLAYVNREFRGAFGEDALPETRELVAQYLLFFHRNELSSYVSNDFRRANIVVRHGISDSHTLNRYVEELTEVLGQLAGPTIRAHVVGENLMVNRAAESLMVAQVKALALLLALIFVLMSIMFTSLKGGAIAMVPALIPIALMFGIMGLLDIPLNPGTAMVAVIAVGIAVDGTIHLLARYNERCRRTSDYVAAVRHAVDAVATPLIVSSLALALGFAVLLLSNFTVVAQFGALAAATMLISIAANLLVTPIIMARMRLVGLYQIMAMKVDRAVLEQSPLFRAMTNYQRRKAILISEVREFAAGERLVTQGTVERSMYLILEGQAEVVRHDAEAERHLAVLAPGEIFGEIGYIRAIERTADVRARTPVSALRFDFERMQQDLKYFPNIVAKLNFNISAILGERLADVLDQEHPGERPATGG